MTEFELEKRVERALDALPAPKAPASLMPRVMAAVAAAAEKPVPWYSRAWLQWPREAQLASLILVVIAGVGLWREVPVVWTWTLSVVSVNAETPAWWASVLKGFGSVMAVARLPWRVLEPVALYFGLLALVASLAMAASWYAVSRLFSGGVSAR
jgi:hypothetical protein